MAFKRVCTLDDLWEGDMEAFKVDGKEVLLVYPEGGEVRAFQAVCPHQDNLLVEGTLEGTIITCPAHLWQFCAMTGRGVNPDHAELAAYPVKVEGDEVYVDVEGIEPKHALPG